jgi:hypothetical protein
MSTMANDGEVLTEIVLPFHVFLLENVFVLVFWYFILIYGQNEPA